jgi:tRNA-splicing ligase RtcB
MLLNETRFGLAEFDDLDDYEIVERKEFQEIKFLKTLQKKFADQLGTSGHGNHFVDIGIVEIKAYSDLVKLHPGKYVAILSHSVPGISDPRSAPIIPTLPAKSSI